MPLTAQGREIIDPHQSRSGLLCAGWTAREAEIQRLLRSQAFGFL
jgi:hypothetical protein